MALSGISGVSGLSGLGIVDDPGIPFPTLNTNELLARFTTDQASRFDITNTDRVTNWHPTQLGVPTFDLIRSNTVDSESPIYLSNDPVFGQPSLNIGFNNRALHANTINSLFANSGTTVHYVIRFTEARTGMIVRYFNSGTFNRIGNGTRNQSGFLRFEITGFDGSVIDLRDSTNRTLNTKYLITHTHASNRQILRVNGTEVVNTFESSHYNTVGTGQQLLIGGSGTGTIVSECANAAIVDLSWYRTHDLARIQNVENTLADYYGITLP